MARPRRNAVYRRATQCEYCGQKAASYLADAGNGLAWYICAWEWCRRRFTRPAPEPLGGGK